MSTMFSKPKMPDTSKQEARIEAQDKKVAEQEAEQEAQQQSMRRSRGAGARRSSLLTGAETGLRETFG